MSGKDCCRGKHGKRTRRHGKGRGCHDHDQDGCCGGTRDDCCDDDCDCGEDCDCGCHDHDQDGCCGGTRDDCCQDKD